MSRGWPRAPSAAKVEWDVLLHTVRLCLWDKGEKPVLEDGCNQALGLLFHTTGKEPLAMFFRVRGL